MDYVCVMHGLDRELNKRRLERLLVVAFDSRAIPVVVLTKADQAADLPTNLKSITSIVESAAPEVKVVITSAATGQGVADFAELVSGGKTAVLLGLSGIGKSTLVNALSDGVVQQTGEVRATDRRGRHTTVTRDLIPLPNGGLLIDTPGVREVGLWQADMGLAKTFQEITDAASKCQFGDCSHESEPNCAIQTGLTSSTLSTGRLDHWRELQEELDTQDTQLEEFNRRSESRQRAKAQDKQNKTRPKKKKRRK